MNEHDRYEAITLAEESAMLVADLRAQVATLTAQSEQHKSTYRILKNATDLSLDERLKQVAALTAERDDARHHAEARLTALREVEAEAREAKRQIAAVRALEHRWRERDESEGNLVEACAIDSCAYDLRAILDAPEVPHAKQK